MVGKSSIFLQRWPELVARRRETVPFNDFGSFFSLGSMAQLQWFVGGRRGGCGGGLILSVVVGLIEPSHWRIPHRARWFSAGTLAGPSYDYSGVVALLLPER